MSKMRMTFTSRRRKQATIKASKQTVEQAMQEGMQLSEQWMADNQNDPRLNQLQNALDFLGSILKKNPQEMAQDGVSSVEEYFDDAIKPDVANKVKSEVDMIVKWRREARPTKITQTAPMAQPTMASDKTANSGAAAFVSDRDEKGEPKTPEKLEVPRLAAKKKDKKEATPEPVPEAGAPVVDPPPAAAAPVTPPPAPEPTSAATGGAVNPIDYIPTETLIKVIEDMPKEDDFAQNKNKQDALIALTEILKARPVMPPEPAENEAAAPVAPAAPAPVPVAASKKSAEDPAKAKVPLGGLTLAATEEGQRHDDVPVAPTPNVMEGSSGDKAEDTKTATGKTAVTPPGISEELMHRLKSEYPGDKEKAYATAWKIHNDKEAALKVLNAAAKAANAQGGSWFIDGGDLKEDGGRTPEIAEAHSKLDDNTGIKRPATDKPSKFAAEMTSGKAVKEAEKLGEELKRMYLDAKALTNVNDTRPVREAVEAIFRAADLFNEATKTLNKQLMQEQAEEEAAKVKSENKNTRGKSGSFLGLSIAASE